MYTPEFPYLGNQAIVSSGRVVVHSYDDFVFQFGKKGVAISTPATVTMDVGERAIIAAPKIELGYNAELNGQPILLGNSTVTQLGILCDQLIELGDALSKLTEKEPEKAIPLIVKAAQTTRDLSKQVKTQLEVNCLSKATYTN